MRIVIDMQGAQSSSRFRGIGRYTMSFTQALVRNRGDHVIILALNGLFPNTIEPIRAAFDSLLPQKNIRVWHAPGPVRDYESENEGRRKVAEVIREAFLASLQPDIIHISSLFEGFVDDAVTSIGRFDQRTPVSVSLYDLIPLLNPEKFLDPNPLYKENYLSKLDHLKKASLYLAISEFTLQECSSYLPSAGTNGINVSTAIDHHFKPLNLDIAAQEKLKLKFGITRPFIFYTGGSEDHKNLPRLIQAFASLESSTRGKYQLVFCGRQNMERQLREVAHHCKLKDSDLIFTGYIGDEDLVQMYNACRLVAFPSWMEGFGLPVLEAMRCGVPVVCGNRSSLPEIIGLPDAMFDPFDVQSISSTLHRGLESENFRSKLVANGQKRAKLFSWDATAQKAIAGFEKVHSTERQSIFLAQPNSVKPKLAFVSPLPPERTGIADFCWELLPALSKYYDIELITDQKNISPEISQYFSSPKNRNWLIQNAGKIDRVIYHFGNSEFHSHMFDLLNKVPGVVVMHDLFLGHVIHYVLGREKTYELNRELYRSHGFKAYIDNASREDLEATLFKYPCSQIVAQGSLALIVHSESSRTILEDWYGKAIADKIYVCRLARAIPEASDRISARMRLGFQPDDYIVCSFGFLGSIKMNDRLLRAWIESKLYKDERCFLVYVGENDGGVYGQNLLRLIQKNNLAKQVRITGFVSLEQYRDFLSAMDTAVQLRKSSRGETSAAALDVMASGTPLIVNAHGSLAEIDTEAACVIPDEFDDMQLVQAIETVRADAINSQKMGGLARKIIATNHSPEKCAAEYFRIIETSYQTPRTLTPKVINAIADRVFLHESSSNLADISQCLAATWLAEQRKKCLFLDISATCFHDLKTGIERVTRSLLIAFLDIEDIRCEPVRLVCENGKWVYRYARAYTSNLLEIPLLFQDELVETLPGDILLSLDLSGGMLIGAEQQGLLQGLRNQGVTIYHILFDLLPVRLPKVFPPGAKESHEHWLRSVAKSDGVFCISKAVADDFSQWVSEMQLLGQERMPFSVDWFHLSPDISASSPTRGMPAGADTLLEKLQDDITFLMVGTIEPRKGYLQTLEAFDILWSAGLEINLVIVGKEGWQPLPQEARRDIPETISRIKNHPQLNSRLFWLEGISDEYLEKAYTASRCLIAASFGEGFGLPLIEAAQHDLPIFARDIPVFREVVGENAFYFKAETPGELAGAIKSWLAEYQKKTHPKPDRLKWSTWKESANKILEKITKQQITKGKNTKKRLFFDISQLVQRDAGTGIQRVVRSILKECLINPPFGYRIEPVYASTTQSYRYAKQFSRRFDPLLPAEAQDEPIDYAPGDIFLGLDFDPHLVLAQRAFYQTLRNNGVDVRFLIYDLLSVRMPESFPPGSDWLFEQWLKVVAESDGAICISKAVADETRQWFHKNIPDRTGTFSINWFHLGADISHHAPFEGGEGDSDKVLSTLKQQKTFLIVSTIEPRKGHAQVLAAFEVLWKNGDDVTLVIVGKKGWMVDDLCEKIRTHAELNHRLFWIEGISDEYLERVYSTSTCLIAASYGEGFGLPLIEAAQHGLPILARDIPVFREVAGEHATYFKAKTPEELAAAIKSWLADWKRNIHSNSSGMSYLTWKESAEMLCKAMVNL